MRITSSMMVNDLIRNLNNNMRSMNKSQTQLSTGKKINQPSDDPAGVVKSLRLRTVINEGEQYLENINEGLNFMETTDTALGNVNEVLQRVRELTVQAANGSNAEQDIEAIVTEVDELIEQLKVIANSTYGSKYIFAGTNVTQAPCEGDYWKGNEEYLQVEIGIGVKIPINLNLKDFFGNPGGLDTLGNPDGGLFDVLYTLKDAMQNGDVEQVDDMLASIDDKIDELLSERAKVGARTNRIELQQNRLEEGQISVTGLLAEVEDADMEEVIMNLQMQENVYRASLAAGARIIQPSLVDFLS